MAVLLFGALCLLLIIGMPIAVSFGLSVIAVFYAGNHTMLFPALPQRMFTSIDSFPFMAIPFFILAGNLMSEGGISRRLLDFMQVLLRRRVAALAKITTGTSLFFGSISGSNPATVAAVGGITIPAMIKKGYPRDLAGAIAASSGTVGVILPPSIPMVTYAVTANVSVGTMFISGIVPGLMIATALFMIHGFVCGKYEPADINAPRLTFKELFLVFKNSFLALLMPILILGGIYGGVFTPTEAAAVSCLYAFIISMFVYRELKLSQLYHVFVKSAKTSAMILFIISLSGPFSWFMTVQGIPTQIAGAVLDTFGNRYVILFLINIILLIIGLFLETQAVILLLTPILIPIANSIGMPPVILGIIIIVNTSIGMTTPPLAVNVFVASGIAKESVEKITYKILPYLAVSFFVLFLLTYFPIFITFFPSLLGIRI